ncbi:OLC1v1016364C1 [Oldenlandia corymbosa var. corymbosa]|uniref:OLC1v1016364C1 n=1 Tax=Oldenlandia corymbosa var. corymbosa TaxID=529605 RepID=A0AAV1E5H9_OLDCO|nr:OLC1v1016364C1 [Oldenlandia corymbosa var. corymbosa]
MVRDSEGKTVLDFVSTIDSVDKVENLRSKYDLPSALKARAPLGNERANSPPRGRITVYDRFMHLGLRFPLYPLFEEIVQHYRTPLARFTPNLITFVLGLVRDWYIVKRRLRTGVKKMVEAYGGSPEWKPDFLFVKAPSSYCLPWNLRETEGLGAIKDEWTQEDEECVEKFQADVEKILKYSKVMSSSNAGSRLFGDEDPFVIVNSDEDVTVTAAPLKRKKKRIVKKTAPEAGPSIVPPVAEKGKGPLEGEAIVLPPQLFEGGPSVAVHTFSNSPSIECAILEEFVAQLNEVDSLRLDPKKTMHEAMVKVLTRLSLEQLPLWGALTGAMPKMSSPAEIASFLGNIPAVLAKGPSEEDPIPEKSWTVHRVHLMVFSEEQSREFPLYAMISGILRSRADVHSLETVAHLESDLLDAMRMHNVKVNQHLINEIKGLREEMQRREVRSLKDHSDSLTFEAEIHDKLVTLEKENAQLRARQQITVSPWFLEKHQVLARVQHMIMVRTRRFIAVMDILKERSREIELLTNYIAQLQNLLLDNNIDLDAFERPKETVDPRTRSSREELLMRVHAQDTEMVDLKNKLNQCVNLLSLHGYKGIIHPSPDNPVREVLIIV